MNKKLIVIILVIFTVIAFIVLTAVYTCQKANEKRRKFEEVEKSFGTYSYSNGKNFSKTYSKENQPKVDILTKETKSICEYIDNFKNTLYDKSKNKEELSIYLFDEKQASKLKIELQSYKKFLIKNFSERINDLEKKLSTEDVIEDNKKISWENYHFENTPLAAISADFQKLQTDIKDIEKGILDQFN